MKTSGERKSLEFEAFVEQYHALKKTDPMDLSSDQDLSFAVMHLISLEEHFFCTGAKTNKSQYYDYINEIREIRKELLKKLVPQYEGEVWCISKHLLGSSMRLMEVGSKLLGSGKRDEAFNFFEKAYDLYSLFWGLNLNIIGVDEIKNSNVNNSLSSSHEKSVFGKLSEVVKKIVDCCIE